MITIEIKANLLRAVQAVAELSVKAKNGRPMFHGAFVDIDNSMMVATNGHTLVAAPALITGVWSDTYSLIFLLSGIKIPAKAGTVIITANDDGSDIRLELPGTGLTPQLLARVEYAKYADWKRSIAPIYGKQGAYKAIGFNPDYINVVGKVIGKRKHNLAGVQFFGKGDTPTMFKVLWSNEPEFVHVVMPARS